MQLKWKHQFQFAGYYMAKELGLYTKAGLDVTIREADGKTSSIERVTGGYAQFGVGGSDLIVHRAKGADVVVLGVVMQHSPLAIATVAPLPLRIQDKITTGPVMIEHHAGELWAYLAGLGVPASAVKLLPPSFEVDTLIRGDVVAQSIYLTDEVYELKRRNVPYRVFRPVEAGIEFYGDNLFTHGQFAAKHPEVVRAFHEASMAGWKYALTHIDESVEVVLKRYSKRHSKAHLYFEARAMIPLIHPTVVEPGFMSKARWQRIGERYRALGSIDEVPDLGKFVHEFDVSFNRQHVRTGALWGGTGLLLVLLLLGWMVRLNVRLRAEIRERERVEGLLLVQARTDSLTGLANRRHFHDELAREQERMLRYGGQFSVVLFDGDHFKSINDVHGHAAGDEALQLLASVIERVRRGTDRGARLGGDEFAVLLPDTSGPSAAVFAERLVCEVRSAVAGHALIQVAQLRISAGVAQAHDADTASTVIMRADRALYEAKAAGRDQVKTDDTATVAPDSAPTATGAVED